MGAAVIEIILSTLPAGLVIVYITCEKVTAKYAPPPPPPPPPPTGAAWSFHRGVVCPLPKNYMVI